MEVHEATCSSFKEYDGSRQRKPSGKTEPRNTEIRHISGRLPHRKTSSLSKKKPGSKTIPTASGTPSTGTAHTPRPALALIQKHNPSQTAMVQREQRSSTRTQAGQETTARSTAPQRDPTLKTPKPCRGGGKSYDKYSTKRAQRKKGSLDKRDQSERDEDTPLIYKPKLTHQTRVKVHDLDTAYNKTLPTATKIIAPHYVKESKP
ncbi:hypothetical protein NDU88_002402 [Pleurodeles waltl]|uniref:Uncharacterized protein n=1 Tax=Pleurodeles waltl TaxID=8319 RepID=A0AAV7VEC6_PLEWA|nr:hypothetical protein NDU88_002402 [Pleurodeles waltl]